MFHFIQSFLECIFRFNNNNDQVNGKVERNVIRFLLPYNYGVIMDYGFNLVEKKYTLDRILKIKIVTRRKDSKL